MQFLRFEVILDRYVGSIMRIVEIRDGLWWWSIYLSLLGEHIFKESKLCFWWCKIDMIFRKVIVILSSSIVEIIVLLFVYIWMNIPFFTFFFIFTRLFEMKSSQVLYIYFNLSRSLFYFYTFYILIQILL